MVRTYRRSETSSKESMISRASKVSPLVDQSWERLKWQGAFQYPSMVRIRTFMDGSCMFHGILNSFFIPYKLGMCNGVPLNRKAFIKEIRKDLSIKLGEPIDPENPGGLRHYDILSRGKLSKFSDNKGLEQYSLRNMQKQLLNSREAVDNVYNEFLSNIFDIDIYMLDLNKKDVYMVGEDSGILYKDRGSVILLYMPGHYELIGLEDPSGNIITYFSPHHSFIESIRARMRTMIKR